MFDLALKIFDQGWKAATEAFDGHYLVINNQGHRSGLKWPQDPKCSANAVVSAQKAS